MARRTFNFRTVSPRPCRAFTGARAFTLIEILMVVLILGIAAAIVVPALGSRSDLQVASAARKLIADLTYAQSLAITQQRTTYIRFSAGTYNLASRVNLTDPLTTITHPVNKTSFVVSFGNAASDDALRNTTLTVPSFGGNTTLAFDSLGSPMTYNSATNTLTTLATVGSITLTSGTVSLTIRIEPYTGEISLQ